MLAMLTALATLLQSGAPPSPEQPPEPPPAFQVPEDWKSLGPDLWFDPVARTLVVRAKVVLRDGPLEHLLCLRQTKEHESILATAAVPRSIQAGLLLTGAQPGHPVRFDPAYEPPAGTPIAIELSWRDEAGQPQRTSAQSWVQEEKSKRPLTGDWVFAGSLLYEDPFTGKTVFGADGGDLITVANFASAILDLPFDSTAQDAALLYEANDQVIPPLDTEVLLHLRPATPPAPERQNPPPP